MTHGYPAASALGENNDRCMYSGNLLHCIFVVDYLMFGCFLEGKHRKQHMYHRHKFWRHITNRIEVSSSTDSVPRSLSWSYLSVCLSVCLSQTYIALYSKEHLFRMISVDQAFLIKLILVLFTSSCSEIKGSNTRKLLYIEYMILIKTNLSVYWDVTKSNYA